MSSQDYSSDEEDLFDESKKSQVLLGFIDTPIDNEEIPTIEDTFVGSQPIWLHENSKPKEKLITCNNCNSKMALYLQAFAPIDGKLYDRVIYVLGCKNSNTCSKKKGSIKAIRGIIEDQETVDKIKNEEKARLDEKLKLEEKKKLNDELVKNLFKEDEAAKNPFGGDPFGNNPFGGSPFDEKEEPKQEQKESKSYADIASKNIPKSKPAKKLHDELPEYTGNFLYVDNEKFKTQANDAELEKYKHLIDNQSDKEDDDEKGNSSSSVLNPQTSKISNMLDDKYFEAFSNTVKHNPGQVLRYDLGGKPLLYNGNDEIAKKFQSHPFNIPKPAFNPSSERQFELQLMPKLIINLENLNDKNVEIKDILNGMSWGTIIVCTDKEDYVPDEEFDENNVAYIEEWCGVQWEESV
ncbi:unnamed protein product [Candida verbasci]|uniref:Programmed cell death protein 2 C-terminal domain-containing protein n=1 Tax=Candida verbasci TaxID=1227364 RepID=A0A9W4TZW3_9ASCO|nr:unnamed protein product [Candida verbasci]